MELQGKHVVVIGTKRSGIAAIELLSKEGAHVVAMDADPQPIPGLNIPVVAQKPENLGDPNLIVLSPAVPNDLPMLNEARMEGIPVIGEVELASYFLKRPGDRHHRIEWEDDHDSLDGTSAPRMRNFVPGGRKYRHGCDFVDRFFARESMECSGAVEFPA